ncbi:D-amino acid dehydrogenase [hydrothermal vent metagenome]|uniref:D-amino acid dehydrogenase n=1 Tax=hydrothermal vent metagenome TaxID=652676 RepID=A0A3B0TR83_9ZZZZ
MTGIDNTVIIIGAGILGVSSAIHLQRRGSDVTIIDRLPPGDGTSFGNAGVLAASSMVPVPVPGLLIKAPKMLLDPDGPLFLKWSYLPRLLPFLAPYLANGRAARVRKIAEALSHIVVDAVDEHQTLARGTGAEAWLTGDDYMFIYRTRAAFEADPFAWELRRQNWPHGWDEIEAAELADLAPDINPAYSFAIRFGHHGLCTSPGDYTKALAEHFVREGGKIIAAEVSGISAPEDGPVAVTASGQVYSAARLVIAAGAYSAKLAKLIGADFPLEAERGYHIELKSPNRTVPFPTMVADGKFVASPLADGLRAAGLVEFGGLDAEVSRGPVAMLRRRIADVLPGLEYESHTEWLGYRPATTDSLPVIGARAGQDNVIYAFGHHHIGLTGAPKTARLLAALMSGERPNIDMAPYSPDRFDYA